MALRGLGYAALMLILVICGARASASAQTNSGVTVLISSVSVNQRNVNIQFSITNDTKARVYLTDVGHEQSQMAFLGSGVQLESPTVMGLDHCDGDMNGCDNTSGGINLDNYSYLDAGQSLSFMLSYQTYSQVNEQDTISFSVVLLASYATPGGDPTQTDSLQVLRFNFPSIPLS